MFFWIHTASQQEKALVALRQQSEVLSELLAEQKRIAEAANVGTHFVVPLPDGLPSAQLTSSAGPSTSSSHGPSRHFGIARSGESISKDQNRQSVRSNDGPSMIDDSRVAGAQNAEPIDIDAEMDAESFLNGDYEIERGDRAPGVEDQNESMAD